MLFRSGYPGQGAIANPVAMLEDPYNPAKVYRVVSNADIDYRLHFLPELRLHATAGVDWARGKSSYYMPANSFEGFREGGSRNEQGPQINLNQVLTLYANYNKEFEAIRSSVDATIGYDYQYWKRNCPAYDTFTAAGDYRSTTPAWDERHQSDHANEWQPPKGNF